MPTSQVARSQCPQNFLEPPMTTHGMSNSNQSLLIKLDERKIFTGSTPPPALTNIFDDANADSQSVCNS